MYTISHLKAHLKYTFSLCALLSICTRNIKKKCQLPNSCFMHMWIFITSYKYHSFTNSVLVNYKLYFAYPESIRFDDLKSNTVMLLLFQIKRLFRIFIVSAFCSKTCWTEGIWVLYLFQQIYIFISCPFFRLCGLFHCNTQVYLDPSTFCSHFRKRLFCKFKYVY